MNAIVDGCEYSILAAGEYSWRAIEAETNTTASNALSSWPLFGRPSKNIVVVAFTRSLSFFSDELQHLIRAASISADNLEVLEENINTVYTILEWEGYAMNGEADKLFALWSMFGGKHTERRNLAKTRNLLRNVQQYRKRVVGIMDGVLQTVDIVRDLREKCIRAKSEEGTIPLEIQVKSIQSALERLQKRIDQ